MGYRKWIANKKKRSQISKKEATGINLGFKSSIPYYLFTKLQSTEGRALSSI